MRAEGFFVTGTDTGVGKTVVAAALVRTLRGAGMNAVPMKPVQTGAPGPGDLDFILAAAGIEAAAGERELMCPYRFRAPCSPHLAAARESETISITRIVESFALLQECHRMVVVEGAGGVLVPLTENETMTDLIAALRLPVILVARPGLGTINHTLLSLRELGRAGATVRGIVVNGTEPQARGYIERDNVSTIERLGGFPVLGTLPWIAGLGETDEGMREFRRVCEEALPGARELIKGKIP